MMSLKILLRTKANMSLVVGGGTLCLLLGLGLLSFVWTPHDPIAIDISQRLLPPSTTAWLGTDHFGRDILSAILRATPMSLSIAMAGVVLGLVGGVPLGLMAGMVGRPLVMHGLTRLGDVLFAFPALIMAMLLTASFGAGASIAAIAIGIFNIPVFLRITRGATLQALPQSYILSARLAGLGAVGIACRHILPNIAPLLVVHASIQFALAVLAESALSYLGLGTQPPTPSWGRMLADSQSMLGIAPHLAIAPGGIIMVTVVAANLLGEGLRQKLDPRLAVTS
ncbi:MAG: ABC transporter permease [Proteobacteria bacterium]|nr:ABC transporter permease [Pseudomonadota bacterium]